MAKILLIETATEVCSAAIAVEGQVVALAEDLQQPNHTARLTLLIDACVKQAGMPLSSLDAVAVSRGPGSYTSLRTGASVAKGICYALDKPLVAVDTLLALAWAGLRITDCGLRINPALGMDAKRENEALTKGWVNPQSAIRNPQSVIFIPMLDARRQEVWTAAYNAHLVEIVPPQPLILQHDLFEIFLQTVAEKSTGQVFVISGNGVKKIGSELIGENVVIGNIKNCSALHLAGPAEIFYQRGDFQDISYFSPSYMKLPNITTPNKPLF